MEPIRTDDQGISLNEGQPLLRKLRLNLLAGAERLQNDIAMLACFRLFGGHRPFAHHLGDKRLVFAQLLEL